MIGYDIPYTEWPALSLVRCPGRSTRLSPYIVRRPVSSAPVRPHSPRYPLTLSRSGVLAFRAPRPVRRIEQPAGAFPGPHHTAKLLYVLGGFKVISTGPALEDGLQ